MILTSPGDIAFTICGLDIKWYGIIMSFAILSGIFFILFIRRKFFKEISIDSILDISFLLIIFGLITARLYYVLLDYRYFLRFPLEIPAVWHGGISIQGAILGGIVAGYFYTKKHKLNFLKYADLFSFGLVLGQIIGRIGNFFNSEAFGLPTNMFLKLYIPYANRPLEYKMYEFFHPTFLYESLLNFMVLAILTTILLKVKERKDGIIFFSYIILYSIVRLFVETLRIDSVLDINNFHAAHIAAIIFIIYAFCGLIFNRRNKQV